MTHEIKSTQNEISIHHKRNSVYITFHCGQNEIKFHFRGGLRKTAHPEKANHICFDEIKACADVSFHIFIS